MKNVCVMLVLRAAKSFLSPKMTGILKERIKEASVALAERVYCPYPDCSELMSRRDISQPVVITKGFPQHINIFTALFRREISQYPRHAAAIGKTSSSEMLEMPRSVLHQLYGPMALCNDM